MLDDILSIDNPQPTTHNPQPTTHNLKPQSSILDLDFSVNSSSPLVWRFPKRFAASRLRNFATSIHNIARSRALQHIVISLDHAPRVSMKASTV